MMLRVGVLLLATAGATSASAAGPLAFPSVDRNRDGVVSWEEARSSMPGLARVHFDKCDGNGDGVVDHGEYALLSTFYWMNYRLPG